MRPVFLGPHDVFTARKQRDEPGHQRTACVGETSDDRDGKPYGKRWMSHVASDDPLRNRDEEEDVHQVHAEGQLADARDPGGSLLDAGEEQECAERGDEDVERTELPRPFSHRGIQHLSGNAFPPEAPCRERSTEEETQAAHLDALRA